MGARFSGSRPEAEQFPTNTEEAEQQESPVADLAAEHTDAGQPTDQGVRNDGENHSDVIQAPESVVGELNSSNVEDRLIDGQNTTNQVIEPDQATIEDSEEFFETSTGNEMLLDGVALVEWETVNKGNQSENAHSEEAVIEHTENVVGEEIHENQHEPVLNELDCDERPMDIGEDATSENTDSNHHQSFQESDRSLENGAEEFHDALDTSTNDDERHLLNVLVESDSGDEERPMDFGEESENAGQNRNQSLQETHHILESGAEENSQPIIGGDGGNLMPNEDNAHIGRQIHDASQTSTNDDEPHPSNALVESDNGDEERPMDIEEESTLENADQHLNQSLQEAQDNLESGAEKDSRPMTAEASGNTLPNVNNDPIRRQIPGASQTSTNENERHPSNALVGSGSGDDERPMNIGVDASSENTSQNHHQHLQKAHHIFENGTEENSHSIIGKNGDNSMHNEDNSHSPRQIHDASETSTNDNELHPSNALVESDSGDEERPMDIEEESTLENADQNRDQSPQESIRSLENGAEENSCPMIAEANGNSLPNSDHIRRQTHDASETSVNGNEDAHPMDVGNDATSENTCQNRQGSFQETHCSSDNDADKNSQLMKAEASENSIPNESNDHNGHQTSDALETSNNELQSPHIIADLDIGNQEHATTIEDEDTSEIPDENLRRNLIRIHRSFDMKGIKNGHQMNAEDNEGAMLDENRIQSRRQVEPSPEFMENGVGENGQGFNSENRSRNMVLSGNRPYIPINDYDEEIDIENIEDPNNFYDQDEDHEEIEPTLRTEEHRVQNLDDESGRQARNSFTNENEVAAETEETGNNETSVDDEFHEFQARNRARIFGTRYSENRSISSNNSTNGDDIDDHDEDLQLDYDGGDESEKDADSPGAMDEMSMNFDDCYDEEMEHAYCARKRDRPQVEERPSSPMTDEQIDAILRAAGVTRFEAGIPNTKKTRTPNYQPEEDLLVVDDIAGPSNSDQVAADLQFALRLQEQEERRFNIQNYCEEIPPPPPRPPPPAEKRDSRANQSSRREQEKAIRASNELKCSEEDSLVQQMWSLYDKCKSYHLKRIPRPMSVPGNLNMADYINGYRRALTDGRFPNIGEGHDFDPFVDVEEEPTTPHTTTTATDPSKTNNPYEHTAFQNFLESANAMINRSTLPAKKEEQTPNASRKRSRSSDDEEPSAKKKENPIGFIGPRMPFADLSEPMCDEEEHIDEYDEVVEELEIDVCGEPEFKTDETGFAVPTVPHRGGLYDDFVFDGPFESSPAARRIQVFHKRSTQGLRGSCPERSKYKDFMSRLADENHPEVVRKSGPESASSSAAYEYTLDDLYEELNEPSPYQRRRLSGSLDPDLDSEQQDAKTHKQYNNRDEMLPCVDWEDPEKMPPLGKVPKKERLKMPAEYRVLIIEHQRKPPPPPPTPYMRRFLKRIRKVDEQARKEKNKIEKTFLELVRRLIPSPNRIPAKIFGSKFEVYARFSFLQRPLYVQNVLAVWRIKDNNGDIRMHMPPEFVRLSMAELCKKAVNIWMGRKMRGQSVDVVLSNNEMRRAARTYYLAIKEKLRADAMLIEDEEHREGALSYMVSQAHSIQRDDVNAEDVSQLRNFEMQGRVEEVHNEPEIVRPPDNEKTRQLKTIARAFTVQTDVMEYDIDLSDDDEEDVEEEQLQLIVDEDGDEDDMMEDLNDPLF